MSVAMHPELELRIREEAKRTLRAKMRALRATIPVEQRAQRTRALVGRLLSLPELTALPADARVASFVATRDEPDLSALHDALRARAIEVVLPRVEPESGTLTLRRVGADSELVRGAFGLFEPADTAEVVPPEGVDLVLVPGLVMDTAGHRIGYGRGFFDRLLPTLPRALRCGVCFDFQLMGELPALPHDVPLDLVITDAREVRVERP